MFLLDLDVLGVIVEEDWLLSHLLNDDAQSFAEGSCFFSLPFGYQVEELLQDLLAFEVLDHLVPLLLRDELETAVSYKQLLKEIEVLVQLPQRFFTLPVVEHLDDPVSNPLAFNFCLFVLQPFDI